MVAFATSLLYTFDIQFLSSSNWFQNENEYKVRKQNRQSLQRIIYSHHEKEEKKSNQLEKEKAKF
jgi:hypothetical protein